MALAVGVPVQGHTHHEDATTDVEAPGHGHGLVIVELEMKLERTVVPVFVPGASAVLFVSPPPLRSITDLPEHEGELCESRAPPASRPRAPPV